MPSSPMDNLPIEILQQVFSLACTDGGATGRALSLVSTRIHDISSPSKYFCIHVSGAIRISRFASFVVEYNPPIQYLMMNWTEPITYQGSSHSPSVQVRNRFGPSEQTRVREEANTIFPVLAPKLRGLYFIPGGILYNLRDLTFPLLHTFLLYDNPNGIYVRWDYKHFPSLKRLDVSCDLAMEFTHGASFSPGQFAGHPTLTHLGCCEHTFDILLHHPGLKLLPNADESDLRAISIRWLCQLPSLQVMRVGMRRTLLPRVKTLARTDKYRLLDKLLSLVPAILFDEYAWGDDISLDEWYHVVCGGEGFQSTQKAELVTYLDYSASNYDRV